MATRKKWIQRGQTVDVKLRRVPPAFLDAIVSLLAIGGRLSPALAERADLARIGRYYATESMLVLDEVTQTYNADATPETGADTLRDHYRKLLAGEVSADLGEHAVF